MKKIGETEKRAEDGGKGRARGWRACNWSYAELDDGGMPEVC